MNFNTSWLLDRLGERSTWIGLTGFLTATGVSLEPEIGEAIGAVGIALASLIAMLTRDR
ncbi:hypothetical protein [Nisaea nitritireducens]|uniref:hypothetical protein n=1 Tax=Nisaea nitritireducens TaxID=568392 RepID=UPI001866C2F5|nr:hypothetical protein [Nisaea nitritireducens]